MTQHVTHEHTKKRGERKTETGMNEQFLVFKYNLHITRVSLTKEGFIKPVTRKQVFPGLSIGIQRYSILLI